MPAPFTIRSIRPNNGIRQVHLTLDYFGQPNEVLLNVTSEIMAGIFGDNVREGNIGKLSWQPLDPETNGPNQG